MSINDFIFLLVATVIVIFRGMNQKEQKKKRKNRKIILLEKQISSENNNTKRQEKYESFKNNDQNEKSFQKSQSQKFEERTNLKREQKIENKRIESKNRKIEIENRKIDSQDRTKMYSSNQPCKKRFNVTKTKTFTNNKPSFESCIPNKLNGKQTSHLIAKNSITVATSAENSNTFPKKSNISLKNLGEKRSMIFKFVLDRPKSL